MPGTKHAFLTEEQIMNAMQFSFLPSILGELGKEKKRQEYFEFTSCYNSEGCFIGYAIEKKWNDNIG
jgi:hypothetical protein